MTTLKYGRVPMPIRKDIYLAESVTSPAAEAPPKNGEQDKGRQTARCGRNDCQNQGQQLERLEKPIKREEQQREYYQACGNPDEKALTMPVCGDGFRVGCLEENRIIHILETESAAREPFIRASRSRAGLQDQP